MYDATCRVHIPVQYTRWCGVRWAQLQLPTHSLYYHRSRIYFLFPPLPHTTSIVVSSSISVVTVLGCDAFRLGHYGASLLASFTGELIERNNVSPVPQTRIEVAVRPRPKHKTSHHPYYATSIIVSCHHQGSDL